MIGVEAHAVMQRGVVGVLETNLCDWPALARQNDWFGLTCRFAECLALAAGMTALQDRAKEVEVGDEDE